MLRITTNGGSQHWWYCGGDRETGGGYDRAEDVARSVIEHVRTNPTHANNRKVEVSMDATTLAALLDMITDLRMELED